MMAGVTVELARFVASLRFSDLPQSAIEKARLCVMDAMGCALAGSRTAEVGAMMRALERYDRWPPGEGRDLPARAAIWGTAAGATVFTAVLLNGTMTHALEFDDSLRFAKVHPGAVVIPAALSLGEIVHVDGKTLITAVAAGYEVMARVGAALDPKQHRLRGWHATSTTGTLGAAAAASVILDLDERRVAYALGHAGTQSGGLWAFLADGAMSKKFHPGRAASSGVLSAILAAEDLRGATQILEAADGGFLRAFSDRYSEEPVIRDLGTGYAIERVTFKPYPCCRTIHPAVEAVLSIRRQYGVEPGMVDEIRILTYEVAKVQNGHPGMPKTVTDAQFSMAYCVAAALVAGDLQLPQFDAGALSDPRIARLVEKVHVEVAPQFEAMYPARWPASAAIKLRNGKTYEALVETCLGDPEKPLTAEHMKRKFSGMAEAIPRFGTARFLDAVEKLEEAHDVSDIVRLVTGDWR